MRLADSGTIHRHVPIYILLIFTVFLNIGIWFYSHDLNPKWSNVPAAPKLAAARYAFLADSQLSYRTWGLALQNFGSTGQTQALKDYNYKLLEDWFFLMDGLDSRSRFMPYIAAYYFSATQDVTQLPHVIRYLEFIGKREGPRNWEWLAQAAYLARHRMKDMNEALRIVRVMGEIYKPGMPLWVKNMEPMIRADMGDKDAAYFLALQILKANGPQMSQSEYTSTVTMICESLLTKEQSKNNPLCKKD